MYAVEWKNYQKADTYSPFIFVMLLNVLKLVSKYCIPIQPMNFKQLTKVKCFQVCGFFFIFFFSPLRDEVETEGAARLFSYSFNYKSV